MCIGEVLSDCFTQFWMIDFDGENIVATSFNDLLGDRSFAAYGINGHYGFTKIKEFQKLRDRFDFVSLRIDCSLAQCETMFGGPSTDAPGQLVMAYAIIEDMGLRKGISNINVIVTPDGNAKVTGSGGKATENKHSEESVAFTWAAESLPSVVPEAAQLGAKILVLGHRASREALEVHGLEPGKYELSIDDQIVGTYTDVQLARHIELQDNNKTPQYQQAMQVAELNRQRNDGPLNKLRGEWRQFQAFARVRKQTSDSFPETINGMEGCIVEHEQAAKEIEDTIFQTNQPQPRRYVLKRMGN